MTPSVAIQSSHFFTSETDTGTIAVNDMSGIFYCGDNLEILDELRLIPDESVDLIYLDPPFNSQRTYNIVYRDSRAQAEAFKDHWSWDDAAPTFATMLDSGRLPSGLKSLLHTLRGLLIENDSDLLAYLAMMTPRLVALHRVLKSTGSLYLHCDPTASHYLKVILDVIFGGDRFANEVVWQRSTAKNDPRRYGRSHDVILYYRRSDDAIWNQQYAPFQDYSVAKNYTAADADGRKYRLSDLTANKAGGDTDYEWKGKRPYKGRHWAFSKEKMDQMHADGRIVFRRTGMPVYKRYLDEMPGVPVQDVWTDARLASASPERLGYPTQKPLALLERIILSSSQHGDLVLDPFCGCGTTIEACERLGRRWIGIDIARKAVEITEQRFSKIGIDAPRVEWVPPDLDAAEALAKQSGAKFEEWARRKIRAVKRRKKDRGIDGEAFFRDANGNVTHVLVSVKSGKLNPAMVRELRGTVERERAPIGVLVTMQDPSKEMRREATHAGFIETANGPIPKMQILTMAQVFAGEGIQAPGVNVTEMPSPSVPTGMPLNQEQLGLKWGPTSLVKPTGKSKPSKPPEATKAGAKKSATG